MLIKKNLILLSFLALISVSYAQEHNNGLGIRGGFFNGITFKHFVDNTDALELILAVHHQGPFIAGIYEKHTNAFDVPGLYWYYGPGAHIGFYQGENRRAWFDEDDRTYTVVGVNAALGMEYRIPEIPFSVGADITPALNIAEHFGFWIGSGISVRYLF